MKNFKIDTFSYGVFYRHARNAAAARQRVVYELFGRGYTGYEHEYWTVTEVPPPAETERKPD